MPEVILSVIGLEKSYDKVTAVSGLDFDIAKGGCFGLLGPNGAGKSSLLRALTGLLDDADWSEFLIEGQSFSDLNAQKRAALIGYCPQNLAPHPDLNVERFLAGSTFSLGLSPKESLLAAHKLLRASQLESLAKRSLSTLSGGEWQRIVLLSLELKDSPFWLLDEP